LLVILILLTAQLISTFAPIIGQHSWRQAETYSIVQGFHESPDFFHPRCLEIEHSPTGVMGMEAPIYAYASFVVSFILGERPQTARLVAWLIFVGGAIAFGVALHRTRGFVVAVSALLALFIAPMCLYETRTIQPDGPMLGFLLGATAAFIEHSRTGRRRDFILGQVLLAAAGLVKLPALIVGPSMITFCFVHRPASWRALIKKSLWFLLPLVVTIAWYRWADYLNDAYNSGHQTFTTKANWGEIKDDIVNWDYYKNIFAFLLPYYAISWCFIPSAIAGAIISFTRGERRLAFGFWLWLVLGLLSALPFSHRFFSHWYYMLLMGPPLAYFVGLAIAKAIEVSRSEAPDPPPLFDRTMALLVLLSFAGVAIVGGKWVSARAVIASVDLRYGENWLSMLGLIVFAVVCALAIVLGRKAPWKRRAFGIALAIAGASAFARAAHDGIEVLVFRGELSDKWPAFQKDWSELAPAVDRFADEREPIVVDGMSPWGLYLAGRKGWNSSSQTLQERSVKWYRDRGARIFVHLSEFDGGPNPAVIEAHPSPLARGDKWVVYCIAQAECPPRR
jgi:4-amino-4-deoxy-L-arabinose transferase-like glycosyltransferase